MIKRFMQLWEFLAVSHQPDKFDGNGYYDKLDLILLIFHVMSKDHVFKGLCNVISGSPL